jgi:hypothetical protein
MMAFIYILAGCMLLSLAIGMLILRYINNVKI